MNNNLKETMNSCQKVKERYVAFMTEMLKMLQKNMAPVNTTTDFPEITYEMAEKFAMHSLVGNPRILYDFFDREKMIVEVWHNGEFNVTVNNLDDVRHFKTRIEAEMDGFSRATTQLEDVL